MKTLSPLRLAAPVLCRWTVLIALAVFVLPAAHAKIHLKISANNTAADTFENWTAGGSWEQITNFKSRNATRPVVDLLLQLDALKAGGLDFDFEFVRTLTHASARAALIAGDAQLTAETVWDDEIIANSATLLKSNPIILSGQFLKGIYVQPTNENMLKISSLDELRQHVCGVVSTWAVDVKTVEDMKLKAIVKLPTPEMAFAAVQKQKADFVLMEFSSNADLSEELGGVKLVPVPNCTVGLMGDRSWAISKAFPDAEAVQNALIKGAKILHENGTIERAYKESGFINPALAGWKRLY